MLTTLIVFVAVLFVLVLVHEVGHFAAARWFGVRVDEFGIGFPPRLWGFRRGQTLYALNSIPLGGYVKIKGEQGDHADENDSFAHKPVWQRGIILLAGVTMNVILAYVLITITLMIGAPQQLGNLHTGATVTDPRVHVIDVLPDSAAGAAGLKPGDILTSINNQPVANVADLQRQVTTDQPVTITYNRDGAASDITVSPTKDPASDRYIIGAHLLESGTVRYPWYSSIWYGLLETGVMIENIFMAFVGLFGNLFSAERTMVDIAGPVGIATITGQIARLGITHLLQFVALLSVNLAIINAIPFPALDGGRLLFLVIEGVRGKPLNPKWEGMVHNAGFLLLLVLIVVITFHDINRIAIPWGQWWDQLNIFN